MRVKKRWALLAALALFGGGAAAGGGGSRGYPECKAEFLEAGRKRDSKRLAQATTDLARAATTLRDRKDRKEKQWVRGMLKRCTAHPAARVRVAALQGYGTMALPGSSRDFRALADRSKNRGEPLEVRLAAIEAWGKVHDPGTEDVLLAWVRVPVENADRRKLAKAAARALGDYRPEKGARRYAFLRAFMSAFDQVHGATSNLVLPSAGATAWWLAVGPEMVRSFNRVLFQTQRMSSYEECFEWWKRNHRKVKAGEL